MLTKHFTLIKSSEKYIPKRGSYIQLWRDHRGILPIVQVKGIVEFNKFWRFDIELINREEVTDYFMFSNRDIIKIYKENWKIGRETICIPIKTRLSILR